MRPLPSPSAVLAAAFALSVTLAAGAGAAVFVPTKTTDSADGACTADCSLREAILAANATPGSDVVLLGAGTYVLSLAGSDDSGAAGDLDVTGELVLIGAGADRTTIDGGAVDRVLHVLAGAELQASDLAVRNGSVAGNGGGILVEGVAELTRLQVAGSHAGGFGGGLYAEREPALLTLRDAAVTGNSAAQGGGGIAFEGPAVVANTTLHGNAASPGRGGGLYAFASADPRLNNVTITGNSAGLEGGGLYRENAAFSGLSFGLANSIVAGNSSPVARDCAGGVTASRVLVGDGTGCFGPSPANHSLVGTGVAPLDPQLAALHEAGGPTASAPPQLGSPAVDAGNPAPPGSSAEACEPADQRGAARPAGAGCDLGAVERTPLCVPGGRYLCLADGRFRVEATYETPAGASGSALGRGLSADSGYLSFFDPSNVEVTVKVLDGCAFNGHYWVFAAGMTNVRVQMLVTDTAGAAFLTYRNPQGRRFRTITDTTAFPCD